MKFGRVGLLVVVRDSVVVGTVVPVVVFVVIWMVVVVITGTVVALVVVPSVVVILVGLRVVDLAETKTRTDATKASTSNFIWKKIISLLSTSFNNFS